MLPHPLLGSRFPDADEPYPLSYLFRRLFLSPVPEGLPRVSARYSIPDLVAPAPNPLDSACPAFLNPLFPYQRLLDALISPPATLLRALTFPVPIHCSSALPAVPAAKLPANAAAAPTPEAVMAPLTAPITAPFIPAPAALRQSTLLPLILWEMADPAKPQAKPIVPPTMPPAGMFATSPVGSI